MDKRSYADLRRLAGIDEIKLKKPQYSKVDPRKGLKFLASAKQNGYTIEIYLGVPKGQISKIMGVERKGTKFIISPDNIVVQAGFWMDWPEKEWKIPEDVYYKIDIKHRAEREARQQLTYAGLAQDFKDFLSSKPTKHQAAPYLIGLREDDITFNKLYKKKNKWIEAIKAGDRKKIKDNLFVMIQNSYGRMGGHVRIQKPSDVLDPELTYWEAVDSDIDPEGDAVIFGRKNFGIKISGMGHDGGKGKKDLVTRFIAVLKRKGYWVEASDKFAEIMIAKGAPVLDDQAKIEKMFGKVTWHGKGWYTRVVNDKGDKSKEVVLGNPKV